MGTKNNPGKYDCHAAADPDEPMFVLLGRDPFACILVRIWADLREDLGRPIGDEEAAATAALSDEEQEKISEARKTANELEAYARRRRGNAVVDRAIQHAKGAGMNPLR